MATAGNLHVVRPGSTTNPRARKKQCGSFEKTWCSASIVRSLWFGKATSQRIVGSTRDTLADQGRSSQAHFAAIVRKNTTDGAYRFSTRMRVNSARRGGRMPANEHQMRKPSATRKRSGKRISCARAMSILENISESRSLLGLRVCLKDLSWCSGISWRRRKMTDWSPRDRPQERLGPSKGKPTHHAAPCQRHP